MTARLDSMSASTQTDSGGQGLLTGVTNTITEQVRRRPLAALGLSLVAGSLIQNVVGGGSGSSGASTTTTTSGAQGATGGATAKLSQAGSAVGDTVSSATDTVTSAAQSAGATVAGTAQQAASTTADAAGSAANTVTDAAQTAAQTASTAVQQAASTTADVASDVAQTATDAVQQAASTAGDLASQASQTVTQTASSLTTNATQGVQTLGASVSQQVQQRPLAALGLAVGAGVLAQPVVAPQVSRITQGVSSQVGRLTQSLSSVASETSAPPPNQQEVERINQALVPATVDRARQFASRDLRELLDRNLEGMISQTSLRAGIVGAVTERAEQLAESRLPAVLGNALTGTRGMIITGLVGQVLRARNEAQQGQGPTFAILRTNLAQSLTGSTREQLRRYFPEFREHYEPTQSQNQQQ
jgi:hypothetical protein